MDCNENIVLCERPPFLVEVEMHMLWIVVKLAFYMSLVPWQSGAPMSVEVKSTRSDCILSLRRPRLSLPLSKSSSAWVTFFITLDYGHRVYS